jgi:hypothetical protein
LDRAKPVPIAVGAQGGVCDLNVSPRSSVGIVHGSSIQYLDAPQVVTVTQTRLDDFAAQEKLKPDIMKIDVEGFEFEVLKGATVCLQNANAIMLDCHSLDLEQQCVRILHEAGYEVCDSGSDVFKRIGYHVNDGGGLVIATKH